MQSFFNPTSMNTTTKILIAGAVTTIAGAVVLDVSSAIYTGWTLVTLGTSAIIMAPIIANFSN